MAKNTDLPWWDDRRKFTCPAPALKEVPEDNLPVLHSPKNIYRYLDNRLFGCEAYKKAISTALWSSINLETKTNFLVIGPSGCGKTELARILKNVYPNMVIFDATSVTPISFKGCVTISQCLLEVDTSNAANPPWIFIDEIDKAVGKGDDVGFMIMNELLKMMEGGQLYVDDGHNSKKLVDTSRVNFVFMGTFASIKKDQKNSIGFDQDIKPVSSTSPITREMICGSDLLSNEFIGRINGGILEVEPMDEAKAAMLLEDVRFSPIARLAEKYQVDIHVTEEKCRELVRLTAKYGVRGIYSELQSLINEAIFEDYKVKSITIS